MKLSVHANAYNDIQDLLQKQQHEFGKDAIALTLLKGVI